MFWDSFSKQAKLREETELQPHQQRAIDKLKKSHGLLVYHGLGSGKTLTSLGATQDGSTDVVVPASLRTNYQKEVKKHTTGHKPNVMSFEKAIKTPPQAQNLVVDEAHNLGDVSSKRTKAMLEHAPEYENRMLLTGTPIKNHPHEIAPLLNIVRGDDEVPTDPKAFNNKFIEEEQVNPGLLARLFRGAKPGVRYKMKNRKDFAKLVDGYVDYHAPDKENFPSTSEETIEVPMNSEQMNYYKFLMGKAGPGMRWKVKSGLPPSKSEAQNLNSFLSGVRQVSNSAKPFGGKETSPKIQRALAAFKERMDADPRFKGVAYSNYLDAGVKEYANELAKAGIPHGVFDGSLSDAKRKQMVDDYNEGKIKALLLSGAGSQGLDLKGTKLMQILEPHWNNPRLRQAEGRAARYKSHEHLPETERNVHIQRFHSTLPKTFWQKLTRQEQKDLSADQYLARMSKEKDDLNNQFLDVLKERGG